jgi:hypothetical protein
LLQRLFALTLYIKVGFKLFYCLLSGTAMSLTLLIIHCFSGAKKWPNYNSPTIYSEKWHVLPCVIIAN